MKKTLLVGGTVLYVLYAAFIAISYPEIPQAVFRFLGGIL
jgi:hypothetical protein